MRAQFATIEAIASLLVVLSAISFVSGEISLNNANVYASHSGVAQSMAAYDFFRQIADNESANGCIALARMTGDSACLDALVESYKEAFGIGQLEVALPGLQAGDAAGGGARECAPIRFVPLNDTAEVCVLAGG